MACKTCGEEPHKCTCQHKDSCMSPAVLEIVNEPEIITFCKVMIPASAGDEKTNPPLNGLYRNALVEYEASGEAYLYSSDGIPTKITDKAELKRLETLIGNEVAERKAEDARLQAQIDEIDISGLEEAIRQEAATREQEDAALVSRIVDNEQAITLVDGMAGANHEAIVALQENVLDLATNKADRSEIPAPYELPVASASTLGGIKVGDNLTIDEDGTLNAQAGGGSGDIVYDRNASGQPIGVNISDNYAQYVKIGNNTTSGKGVTVTIGDSSSASSSSATAVGPSAKATNPAATALGYNTTASGNQSIAIGSAAYSTASHSVAVGHNSEATGSDATAFGSDAKSRGTYSTALGGNAVAQANYGIAVGAGASVSSSSEKSVALGYYATANNKESVAIGYDSSTGRENEVSVGSSGTKRYIANVQDASLDYDAVNKRQLDALSDRVDEISLAKAPNVTIIGTPTINQGQASAFSESNYLQFPFVLDMTGKTFQIDFCFTTGQQVATQQNLIDSKYGIALAISNNVGVMSISSNGTSWNVGTARGTTVLQPNTTYFARLSWNGTTYKTALSTDGVTYTDDMTITSSVAPFPTTHYIGGVSGTVVGHTAHPFGGIIDLNKCKLTVNDELVWEGMDSAGLRTRADVSLSNIDAAGEQRIKDIAGSGGGGEGRKTYYLIDLGQNGQGATDTTSVCANDMDAVFGYDTEGYDSSQQSARQPYFALKFSKTPAYADDTDYDAALTELMNDLTAGTVVDIVVLGAPFNDIGRPLAELARVDSISYEADYSGVASVLRFSFNKTMGSIGSPDIIPFSTRTTVSIYLSASLDWMTGKYTYRYDNEFVSKQSFGALNIYYTGDDPNNEQFFAFGTGQVYSFTLDTVGSYGSMSNPQRSFKELLQSAARHGARLSVNFVNNSVNLIGRYPGRFVVYKESDRFFIEFDCYNVTTDWSGNPSSISKRTIYMSPLEYSFDGSLSVIKIKNES